MADYMGVIGLEIHIQLKTKSKLFCGCSAEYGGPPNTRVCPVCLGMPGALPQLNQQAVEYAMKMALAVGSTINEQSVFARKNYFYPDLTKGYQISQFEYPLAEGGNVTIHDKQYRAKQIRLNRIHLEEEAGKSFHDIDSRHSFTDYNRCGIPLIEIVTEPDLRNGEEACALLNKIKQVAEYLDITTGNMEQGALRCDVNISVRPVGQEDYNTRREIKNMNSFKFAEKAIDYEIFSQIGIIEAGGKIDRQTMLWDEKSRTTRPMRAKEGSADYRYFPEPDLLPLKIRSEWIEEVERSLPELPDVKINRFVDDYNILADDARVLTSSRSLADYYEIVARKSEEPKLSANWVMTELMRVIKETDIERIQLKPENLAELIIMIKSNRISGRIAKDVFSEMILTGKSATRIVENLGLSQISDESELAPIIEKVLSTHQNDVKIYLTGKEGVLRFFVGLVMRETNGRANPELVNELFKKALKGRQG